MERKQIYIAGEQEEGLKRLASRRHVSVSHLIREAVALYLAEADTPDIAAPEDHPLWSIVGIAGEAGLPRDGSVNHDRALYERAP